MCNNYHTLCGLKQHTFIVSQVFRSEVQYPATCLDSLLRVSKAEIKVLARLFSFLKLWGTIFWQVHPNCCHNTDVFVVVCLGSHFPCHVALSIFKPAKANSYTLKLSDCSFCSPLLLLWTHVITLGPLDNPG